jgi:hypothetical protein
MPCKTGRQNDWKKDQHVGRQEPVETYLESACSRCKPPGTSIPTAGKMLQDYLLLCLPQALPACIVGSVGMLLDKLLDYKQPRLHRDRKEKKSLVVHTSYVLDQ